MGLCFVTLKLLNPRRPELQPVEAEALADTGSNFLCIPETVALQLQLDEPQRKEIVTLADGRRREVPYVGPIEIRFKNRVAYVGALVLGESVLLGAIPMEDMDLVVLPSTQSVDVNPASPNIATAICMSHRVRD
jgi:clan AA aspartic protease